MRRSLFNSSNRTTGSCTKSYEVKRWHIESPTRNNYDNALKCVHIIVMGIKCEKGVGATLTSIHRFRKAA